MNKWLVVNIFVLVSLVIELMDPAAPFVRVDSSPKRNSLTAKKCSEASCTRLNQSVFNEQLANDFLEMTDDEQDEEEGGDEGSNNTHFSLVAGIWSVVIAPLSSDTKYTWQVDSPLCGASRHLIRPPILRS